MVCAPYSRRYRLGTLASETVGISNKGPTSLCARGAEAFCHRRRGFSNERLEEIGKNSIHGKTWCDLLVKFINILVKLINLSFPLCNT